MISLYKGSKDYILISLYKGSKDYVAKQEDCQNLTLHRNITIPLHCFIIRLIWWVPLWIEQLNSLNGGSLEI